MVKIREPDEHEKLEAIIEKACESHGLKLDIQGWTRKTYDIFVDSRDVGGMTHLIRLESFATRSGEIRVFHDDGLAVAQEIGAAMEGALAIEEAVIIRDDAP